MGFYDYSVPATDGSEVSMKDYEGKVVLVVNTATGCGFTPQYEPIEEMYEKYHDCTLQYNTKFPQMKKSDVNGENQLALYKFLKEEKGFEGFGKGLKATGLSVVVKKMDKDYKNNPDIKWNFTKFVVDRNGDVVERFEPTAKMEEVEKCVASLI